RWRAKLGAGGDSRGGHLRSQRGGRLGQRSSRSARNWGGRRLGGRRLRVRWIDPPHLARLLGGRIGGRGRLVGGVLASRLSRALGPSLMRSDPPLGVQVDIAGVARNRGSNADMPQERQNATEQGRQRGVAAEPGAEPNGCRQGKRDGRAREERN